MDKPILENPDTQVNEIAVKEAKENSSKIQEYTIDELYDLSGGHGKYQFLVAASIIIPQITAMIYMFTLPLFQTFPVILNCPRGICKSKEEACALPYRKYAEKHSNFLTEFDLVCSDLQASFIITVYPSGYILGTIIFNTLSDNIGRIPTVLMGQFGTILSLVFLTVFANYQVCLICTFLYGCFAAASSYHAFTFTYDNMHSRYFLFYATYVCVIYAIGEIFVSLINWTGAEWRTICYCYIAFAFSYAIFPCFLDEAPRYLHSKGKYEDAINRFKEISLYNNSPINNKFKIYDQSLIATTAGSLMEKLKLVFSKKLFLRLLLCLILFFSCGFIYSGLSLNVEKFKGNVYLNALFNAIAEIIADILACLVALKIGSKYPLIVCYTGTAICLILQYMSMNFVVLSSISMYFGKFFISAAFTLIYAIAGQLIPNTILSMGLGILNFGERIAIALSPIIGNIQQLYFFLAVCCSIASAIASIFVARLINEPK